jgi:hypothetical protein
LAVTLLKNPAWIKAQIYEYAISMDRIAYVVNRVFIYSHETKPFIVAEYSLGKANLTSLSSHAMLQAIIEDTRAGLEEQYAKTEAISKAATRRSTLGREEKYFEPEPHRKPC